MFSLIVGESTYSLPVRFACSTIFDLSPITTRFQDASVSLSLVGSYHTANVFTFVFIRHGRHGGQRPDCSQSVQGLGTSYSHLRIPFSSFLAKFMLEHLDLTQQTFGGVHNLKSKLMNPSTFSDKIRPFDNSSRR